MVEGNLSEANFGLGRYQRSLEHGERGLRLRRQAQDLSGEAGALTLLARTWHALHDTRKAIELCQQAIAIGRRTLIIRYETLAEPLDVLAICQHHLGHTIDAIKCWQEAATIYDDSGHARKAAEVRQRLHQAQAAL
ncbi:tetratricopeptide repeat protein [Amycolatopsis sp. w19]|uniref:tetratricopeptide repeat protein n=1 Tax=Amycolatopsis sp. w19 TaxID=3448134 RepID=UPI003F1DF511